MTNRINSFLKPFRNSPLFYHKVEQQGTRKNLFSRFSSACTMPIGSDGDLCSGVWPGWFPGYRNPAQPAKAQSGSTCKRGQNNKSRKKNHRKSHPVSRKRELSEGVRYHYVSTGNGLKEGNSNLTTPPYWPYLR